MIARMCATLVAIALASAAVADEIRLAVTTSFENSGLADVLVPQIKADLDLDVQLLVVGTGQALRLGQAGDVDAILVHSRTAEEEFIAAGYGTHRREIMYNDFVVIGPADDPAGVAQATSAAQVLAQINVEKPAFVSRGDDSGTHKKERALWQAAGLNADDFGSWYREVGAGMGASLNTAAGLGAYILADRASWLNFGNKADLALLFAGDPALFNQYAFLPVNSARHTHVRQDLAQRLEDWLTSARAATLINDYTIDGKTLFIFNATD
ncbi:substrate-binding domain-containing protein [Roseobacter sp.]|uniref:substrate-binding domain-containing protein n=1 Tax=Roseobacter sp. TaxID=1907202 RepID=UPI003297A04C